MNKIVNKKGKHHTYEHIFRRISNPLFTLALILCVFASAVCINHFVAGGPTTAIAATIGQKNQQACDDCETIRDGNAPTDARASMTSAI